MKKRKLMSFSARILMILLLTITTMIALTMISMHELRLSMDERQMALISNNFSQAHQTLEEKMQGVHAISTQMIVNDRINEALRSASMSDVQQQLTSFEVISAHTRMIEMSHDGMGIYLFVDDDYIVAQDRSTRYRNISAIKHTDWYDTLVANQGHPMWIYTTSLLETGAYNLMQVRLLMDHNDYSHALGVLSVSLSEDHIQNILHNAIEKQYMAIFTEDGMLLTDNGQPCPQIAAETFVDTMGAFQRLNIDGANYYLSTEELLDSGLYLVSVLPRKIITSQVNSMQARFTLSYLLVFAAMALFTIPVASSIVRRINLLGRQLEEVPTQGLKKLQSANTGDEISQLISAYNNMVEELERMLDTQYELGRAKAGAELKALQSQINPHFLYNTLDMVSWMAKKQETDKIQLVMVSLSRFYKLTLSGGRDVITLQEELSLCNAYMNIQQLRWEGAIDYLVEADDSLMNACLPKITLQPLIENAIKHGIMQRGEVRGSIIISAMIADDRDGQWMTLSVLDNGVGMEDSQAMLEKGQGHYGMKNIQQRLELYFGEEIGIQVDSEAGLGTCVSLTLPIKFEKEADAQ